jgi:hypothetical protein
MPLSKRFKSLLNWWELRIQKTREETKEKNVKGNDTNDASTNDICVGIKDKERQRVNKGEE